jgi:hypothetical protein
MRTTLRLDDALLEQAKRYAAQRGETLTAVFEAALREKLARSESTVPRRKVVRLPTFRGRGARPGVDLHDTSSLLDRMERAGS